MRKLLHLWQGGKQGRQPERREATRLIYPSDLRPVLKIENHTLEVINISVNGLKFLNPLHRKIGSNVFGTLCLLTGRSVDIRGKIKWEYGNEMGLMSSRISESLITEEVRVLLRQKSKDENRASASKSREKDKMGPISNQKLASSPGFSGTALTWTPSIHSWMPTSWMPLDGSWDF